MVGSSESLEGLKNLTCRLRRKEQLIEYPIQAHEDIGASTTNMDTAGMKEGCMY
jgi:hypothetical protein